MELLGCILDTNALTISLPDRKVQDIIQALRTVRRSRKLERFRALQPTARPTPTRAPAAIRKFLANPTEDCRAATGYAI
ncbi:hypothetical protein FJT64_014271 [Amphibalanus amphitrite]|uniref:Uncharacterized protein n=1 Tax=Amphibalanus amphitrite TaxID=1232801 RepID=A0A6A4V9H2_AMPAM|nr:hypothetical protein FJT64_014271 [Amphibalanus amphitrite]